MVAPALIAAGASWLANNKGKIGSFLQDNIGTIMGLFSKNANSAQVSFDLSKKLQEHQFQLNRLTRQTSFQDTRHSLEAAGYNPLLAVGEQAQGGTYGATLSAQDPQSENLQNAIALAQNASQIQLNSANANYQKRDIALKTIKNDAECGLLSAQTEGQHIENNIRDITGLSQALAELDNRIADTDNKRTEKALIQAKTGLTRLLQQATQADTENTKINSAQAKMDLDWNRKHPNLYTINRTSGSFGSIAGGIGNLIPNGKNVTSALKALNSLFSH